MASGNRGRGRSEVPALGGHDALASSSEQGGHVMPYRSVAHLDHVASVVVEHWVPSGRYGGRPLVRGPGRRVWLTRGDPDQVPLWEPVIIAARSSGCRNEGGRGGPHAYR